ncbi:hypothetical protein ACFW24_01645 [Streptomyces nigra]|uniref:hypothetical protein n=1 Tax=Streptomyces nigra TaxID=1827580 RepID=UPI003674DEF7
MNSLRQARTWSRRAAGGSISETNSTPSPPISVWVAMNAPLRASSRAVRGAGASPVWVVRTWSRTRSGASRSAVTVTLPRSSSRTRTTRPASPGNGSTSVPPGAPTGTVVPWWARSSRRRVTSASRGTASSKVRCTVPSAVRSDGTSRLPPSGPVSWTCLRCICRYRSRTRTVASGRRIRARHSVRWYQESAEPDTVGVTGPSASTQSRGKSTPNCQRTRFFADDRRYG